MTDSTNSSWCADQVRRLDHDRYLTVLFSPADRRANLFALYAFNVEVAKMRETVSEVMLGRIRLQWWREALDELFAGEVRRHPVLQALEVSARAGTLPREGFERLIDAREADLDDAPPDSLTALEAYAAATSGELSALALRLVGVSTPAALQAAEHVGTAWALVGLMRAVAFHAQARRLFLPEDLMREFGIDRGALLDLKPTASIDRVVREVVDRARGHLEAARRARPDVPPQGRAPLLLASLADAYIGEMARYDYDMFALPPAGRPRPLRLLAAHLRGRY